MRDVVTKLRRLSLAGGNLESALLFRKTHDKGDVVQGLGAAAM